MIGINFDINVGRAVLERTFYVTITCETGSAAWNLCSNSAFALGAKETKENFAK
jgi:hypothetical protein